MEAYGNQEYEQEIYLFKCRDLIHKNKVSSSESLCPVRYMYAYSTYIFNRDVSRFLLLTNKVHVHFSYSNHYFAKEENKKKNQMTIL